MDGISLYVSVRSVKFDPGTLPLNTVLLTLYLKCFFFCRDYSEAGRLIESFDREIEYELH